MDILWETERSGPAQATGGWALVVVKADVAAYPGWFFLAEAFGGAVALGGVVALFAAADAGAAVLFALFCAAHLAALVTRCAKECKEDPAVQTEIHRLREDQRARGGLSSTLNSLNQDAGAGGGPNLLDPKQLMATLQGGAGGAASPLAGIDLASLDLGAMGGGLRSAAADHPSLRSRWTR